MIISGLYEYELTIRNDLYTSRHTQVSFQVSYWDGTQRFVQWYYFSVSNTRKGVQYQFKIVNMLKVLSLFSTLNPELIFLITEWQLVQQWHAACRLLNKERRKAQ